MKGKRISAKDLRKNKACVTAEPGIYKWWAKKPELKIILDKLKLKWNDLVKGFEEENGWFCIYVGQATSLESRLVKNHIMGKRKSTLRRSIDAIIKDPNKQDNKEIKESINSFIDKLEVEYKSFALEKLDEMEKKEIGSQYLRIFNGAHNSKNELRKLYGISKRLTALRNNLKILKK